MVSMSRLFSIVSCFIALLFLINNDNINNVSALAENEEFILQWYYFNGGQKIRRIVSASKFNNNEALTVFDYDGTQRGINNARKFIWREGGDPTNSGKILLSINNQCIDLWGGNIIDNGAPIGMYDCTTGTQAFQQWYIRNNRMIQYANYIYDRCLGVENNNQGAILRLYPCNDNDPHQQFDFISVKNIPPPIILITGDQFILQWTNGGSRYLFDSSSTPDNAILGNTINLSLFDGTINTVSPGNKYSWIVTDSVNGIGKIKTTKNNLCYDLPYGRTNNGNAITMYDCNIGGQANQQWKFRNGINNNQKMIQYGSSPNQEKCLGVDTGVSPLTIKLYDCNNNDTKQQFDFILTSTFY